MDFNLLFGILKKHMADGDDVPYFFREIMAMITTVSEEDWGTGKDPSKKLSDSTIRSYANRGLPKKLAQTILYRLTPEVLTERINGIENEARKSLAEDLISYDADTTVDNVAEKVSDWMMGIIRESAGLAPDAELEKKKKAQKAQKLKDKYGDYLLREAEDHCPFPGCSRQLIIANDGKAEPSYEVSLIEKDKSDAIQNLIALCPVCYANYQVDDTKKTTKKLKEAKQIISAHLQSAKLLNDLNIQKGLEGVIEQIKKLKESDLTEPLMDPKEIKEKINPDEDMALYRMVNNFVVDYFITIKEIMVSLDKKGVIDYEEIQDQMRAIYRRLKKSNKSNMAIFNEIVGKIHKASLQDDIYCQIVVAYFIQKCEVFDAVTE